jgi:hypothetical protein
MTRAELGLAEVRIDFHWIRRQRAEIGEPAFQQFIREMVGNENAEQILKFSSGPTIPPAQLPPYPADALERWAFVPMVMVR